MLHLTPVLTVYLSTLLFILGAVAASFLSCVAVRRHRGESVLCGRSHCDSCGHVLGPAELIPILGYLFSRGRCRHCDEKISPLCLWGEISLAITFLLFLWKFDVTRTLLLHLFFGCILFYISITDLTARTVPNGPLLLAAVVRLLYFVVFQFSWQGLGTLLFSCLVPSLPVLLLALLLERFLKREAMGGGDIKLLAVLGLYLGWTGGILMLFLACALGIFTFLLFSKRGSPELPFGPFLSASAVLAVCFGDWIVSWYSGFFL